MANSLLTPTMVTREALRILHQKLNFVGNVNKQYDDRFANNDLKIGESLKVRLPNKYTTRTGATLSTQDTFNRSVLLTGSTLWGTGANTFDQVGVDLNFTSADLTFSIEKFSANILEPAMAVLASTIEYNTLNTLYKRTPHAVGTPGSPVNSLNLLLQARKKLTDYLTPADKNRNICISTQHNLDMVDSLKGLMQPGGTLSEQYKEGMLGYGAGFNFYENTLLPRHTAGVQGGTPTVNGAQGQNGGAWTERFALVTQAWSNSITNVLREGDIITIANVFAVHPETRANTGQLQQFVVREKQAAGTWDSSGAGALTVDISPSPIYAGPYQNINAQIANGAAITVVGTTGQVYGQSLAFHRDAYAFVTADLVMPKGVDFSAREVYDGISMRIVRQYDITNDKFPCRIDVAYAMGVLYPEFACRVIGNG